jgi:hypothetical protein
VRVISSTGGGIVVHSQQKASDAVTITKDQGQIIVDLLNANGHTLLAAILQPVVNDAGC